jgi:hypothetical protein
MTSPVFPGPGRGQGSPAPSTSAQATATSPVFPGPGRGRGSAGPVPSNPSSPVAQLTAQPYFARELRPADAVGYKAAGVLPIRWDSDGRPLVLIGTEGRSGALSKLMHDVVIFAFAFGCRL